MPRDGCLADINTTISTDPSPVAWHCARCDHRITRQAWAIRMNDAHDHVVFNPAGIVFRVVCFSQAPGVRAVGPASTAFSWFKGYGWRLVVCGLCHSHLGWLYQGDGRPRQFHGLIRPLLIERPE